MLFRKKILHSHNKSKVGCCLEIKYWKSQGQGSQINKFPKFNNDTKNAGSRSIQKFYNFKKEKKKDIYIHIPRACILSSFKIGNFEQHGKYFGLEKDEYINL